MYTWLFWRLGKWLGLVALAAAVGGTVWARGSLRRRAGLQALPVSLLVVFITGYGLLHHREQTFTEPFVLLGLAAGVVCASGAVLHATTSRSRLGAGAALGGLIAAVGFMVFREQGLWLGAPLGGLGFALGAATASHDDLPSDPEAIWRWFTWVGRAEGVSLLFLFGVAMPFKYALGQPFLVAWTGWLHGVFFLLYIGALAVGVLRLGWSLLDAVLGAVASLLPFGTFVFERRVAGRRSSAAG